MAESYGFFDAIYDSSTDEYDRVYVAEQFANYFKLMVKNGVFNYPTNQLKVVANGTGLYVNVNTGWAFINGYWFHNDEIKTIQLLANETPYDRYDSIRVRLSISKRDIEIIIVSDGSDLVRNESIFDLEIARVLIRPSTINLSNSDISDTRPDTDRCGFVQGIGEFGGEKEFVISNRSFNFVNKECLIEDSRITSKSLADVYFTSDTYSNASKAQIYVETYNGYLMLVAEKEPEGVIYGTIKIRVV